ncbi:hypothetical protein ABZX93_26745 [Streptomyces sp. NPDC006632]|uniref:hypothetical protein n=1 Tax=Streptomyces sp. NPDC006632 TaxID=3157182 RepID=UPI0033A306E5
MVMDEGWLRTCAVRYCAVFGIGWIVTAVCGPPGDDPHQPGRFVEMSRFDSFKDYMSAAPGFFLWIGVPSLLILMVMACRARKVPMEQLRVQTGLFLLLPLCFVLVAGGAIIVLIQVVALAGFVALIPVPEAEEGS